MATSYLNTQPITVEAGADLSAAAGLFGKINAQGRLVLALNGELGFPILLGAPNLHAASIATPGSIVKMRAASAINAGAPIKSDATSRAEDATATAVSGAAVTGSNVLGYALSTVANANELVEVLFLPIGALVTTPS